jgi:hypothetical protein
VSRIVLVPPSWEGDRNDLAVDAARSYPDRFAVMGRLALQKPESRALASAGARPPRSLWFGSADFSLRRELHVGLHPRMSDRSHVVGAECRGNNMPSEASSSLGVVVPLVGPGSATGFGSESRDTAIREPPERQKRSRIP